MAYYVLNDTKLSELSELSASSLGVIQKNSGTAMNPNARTLVIGLGGMGLATVYELKKTLEERIGKIPDNSPDIKFLAIDTSKTELNLRVESGVLSEQEVFHLYNDHIGLEMRRSLDPNQRALVSKPIENIIPPIAMNFNPGLAGSGANQVRLAGRLSLMEPDIFVQLYNRIKSAITALSDFTSRNLEVYIAAGIGGGTGSGLVVDIPYLVRKVLSELGVQDTKVRIFGHIFLPNVYDGGQVASLTGAYRNGYAALKEIDYYMNIERINETYDIVFPSVGAFSSSKGIFNLCTLVGGKIATNKVLEDPKKSAIECCVANLVNQVTSAKASDDKGAQNSLADIFTSDAFLDNINSALNSIFASGDAKFHNSGNYKYACVGSATLKFPSNAIVECFVGDAYAKMIAHLKQRAETLQQKDIDAFAKGLIAPDDLLAPYLSAFMSKMEDSLPDMSEINKRSVTNSGDIDSKLNRMVDNFEMDTDLQMIPTRIAAANNKAAEIFKDSNRGPFYLARLLTSRHQTDGVVGYYEKLDAYVNEIVKKKQNAEDEAKQAEKDRRDFANKDMQKLIGGCSDANKEKYLGYFREIYRKKLEAKLCDKLANEYYHAISNRVGACYKMKINLDTNYLYYVDILSRIGEILAQNVLISKKELSSASDDAGNILALSGDACLRPLQFSVEKTLENKKKDLTEDAIKAFAAALTGDILDKKEAWAMAETVNRQLGMSRPANAFRAFVKNYAPFADVVNQSFAGYFEAAYKDETESAKSGIVSYLVNYLRTNSSPMFNIWNDFSWASIKELQHQYMIIPNNMGEYWGEKFKTSIGFNGMTSNIFESPDQSAIYNYTLYAGLPMWLHADIVKYEEKYYAMTAPGVHINENERFQPSYKEYPSLMPQEQWFHAAQGSQLYQNDAELAIDAEIKTLVNSCLKHGIIHMDTMSNLYVVDLIKNKPEPGSDKLKTFFKRYHANPDNLKENGMLKEGANLYNALLAEYGATRVTIASVGHANVRPDSVDLLPTLIRQQMKLVGLLRKERAYLLADGSVTKEVERFNGEIEGNKKRNEYFSFLFYGLIAPGERGVWSYRLGEKTYQITSKLEVGATERELVDYMEMAVYNAFYKHENIDAHVGLLRSQVSQSIQAIVAGSLDVNEVLKNYNTYVDGANEKLGAFMQKLANGEALSPKELEIKEFYEALKAEFNAIYKVFS